MEFQVRARLLKHFCKPLIRVYVCIIIIIIIIFIIITIIIMLESGIIRPRSPRTYLRKQVNSEFGERYNNIYKLFETHYSSLSKIHDNGIANLFGTDTLSQFTHRERLL